MASSPIFITSFNILSIPGDLFALSLFNYLTLGGEGGGGGVGYFWSAIFFF